MNKLIFYSLLIFCSASFTSPKKFLTIKDITNNHQKYKLYTMTYLECETQQDNSRNPQDMHKLVQIDTTGKYQNHILDRNEIMQLYYNLDPRFVRELEFIHANSSFFECCCPCFYQRNKKD